MVVDAVYDSEKEIHSIDYLQSAFPHFLKFIKIYHQV